MFPVNQSQGPSSTSTRSDEEESAHIVKADLAPRVEIHGYQKIHHFPFLLFYDRTSRISQHNSRERDIYQVLPIYRRK